jgi:hypothetical protein
MDMLKKFVAGMSTIMPFLASYPIWVRVVAGIWVCLTIVLILSLLLFRITQKKPLKSAAISTKTPLFEKTKQRIEDFYVDIDRNKLTPWSFFRSGKMHGVKDYYGKPIYPGGGGAEFEGSPSKVFWGNFIEPFLEHGIINILEQVATDAKESNLSPELCINEAVNLLDSLITRIYYRMAEIDQNLRGKGDPKSVKRKDVTQEIQKMVDYLEQQQKSITEIAISQSTYAQKGNLLRDKKFVITTCIAIVTIIVMVILNCIKTARPLNSIKPVLEMKVDSKKILTLKNKGLTDLKGINIFATRYVFDENCFGEEFKIKEYNKIGGSLYNISTLKAKIGRESFDLTEQSSLEFYEAPFGKDNYKPFMTFYCLRVTYRETNTGAKYADYIVTTAYKNYPSPIENQEVTASFGTIEGDSFYKIPEIIKNHQKTIFGE